MNMRPIEQAVLENHLTEYPLDWSFQQVCDWLWDAEDDVEIYEQDKVQVWEMFEDWNKHFLVEHMKQIVESYEGYVT